MIDEPIKPPNRYRFYMSTVGQDIHEFDVPTLNAGYRKVLHIYPNAPIRPRRYVYDRISNSHVYGLTISDSPPDGLWIHLKWPAQMEWRRSLLVHTYKKENVNQN